MLYFRSKIECFSFCAKSDDCALANFTKDDGACEKSSANGVVKQVGGLEVYLKKGTELGKLMY